MSLCLPPARIAFWTVVARGGSRVSTPVKTSLNWFMPALANSSVGSLASTTGDERTIWWPRSAKKSRKPARISFPEGDMAANHDIGWAAMDPLWERLAELPLTIESASYERRSAMAAHDF